MTYENIYTLWGGESTVLQYPYIELLYLATFKNVSCRALGVMRNRTYISINSN